MQLACEQNWGVAVSLGNEHLEEVEKFYYLGNIIDSHGGNKKDKEE